MRADEAEYLPSIGHILLVVEVREGRLPRQALLKQQDRFDTYFLDSAAGDRARPPVWGGHTG